MTSRSVANLLVDSELAINAAGTWNYANGTISNITEYGWVYLICAVYGALTQNGECDVRNMRKFSHAFTVAVTWNSTNLGNLTVRPSGSWDVAAKTGQFQFIYKIIGIA